MKKGALIIENRFTSLDEIIERHAAFLPDDWQVAIIDDAPVKTMADYNKLLTSKAFWEAIPFDRVLIFQHDSGLLRKGIEEFLEWDYVGAPWPWQEHGGNGGLSLRNPKAMIAIIEAFPYNPAVHGNEDVYFSNHMEQARFKLAPRNVCSKFSVESVFALGTIGYHAADKYLTQEEWQQIKDYSGEASEAVKELVHDANEQAQVNQAMKNWGVEAKDVMAEINFNYAHACTHKSDINEHLPVLKAYAEKCAHITEMGVRDVVSTWAFLAALPKKLRCIDIHKSPKIDIPLAMAKMVKVDMKFKEADCLTIKIEKTDLLFIDTLHTYTQLKKELELHAGQVKKYIIFHDVVTYGHTPEPASWQTPEIMKNYVENDKGLMPAIEEFLAAHPEWERDAVFTNNNGLLIIRRIK